MPSSSSPGRLARRPSGPLKETGTLSPRDPLPQRCLFPGRGRGVDPGGGGAEQELGIARRRSRASWAFPARFSKSQGYSSLESLAGDRFRILRVAVVGPRVGLGTAGQSVGARPTNPVAAEEQVRGPIPVARWVRGPQMQLLPCHHRASWANNPGQHVSNFLSLEPLDQLRTFPRKMSKLYPLKCTHILTSMKIRICT